ncbi:MAG: histidinol dehydrogenase [Candidatus Bathyarchaeia archaeon]
MPNELGIKNLQCNVLPPGWFKRGRAEEDRRLEAAVRSIAANVKKRGDRALVEYTEKFDKTKLKAENLRVTPAEVKAAYAKVTQAQVSALKLMKEKLAASEKLALKQKLPATSREGITVRTVLKPIESVGCYVPGGQAAYPSTLVMTAVPAKVAGVPRIVVCSPPTSQGAINPLIVVAADICGVSEVYKVGGVQAIAALAYGTETIQPVRKIVGPGSRYVTAAKVLVSRDVAIDMPAGPSEVLVLADETANPKFIAADMVSQAEHGADSVAGLVTTSEKVADETLNCIREIAASAERRDIVEKALSAYGFIITCKSTQELVALANAFAPEHLEIVTRKPEEIASQITSAGLVLLGPYSPVALSDYGSGTNHVLPTGGFGKAFSGLSALDFTKRVTIVESSREGLEKLRNHVKILTEAEDLPNHYKAVEARFES